MIKELWIEMEHDFTVWFLCENTFAVSLFESISYFFSFLKLPNLNENVT